MELSSGLSRPPEWGQVAACCRRFWRLGGFAYFAASSVCESVSRPLERVQVEVFAARGHRSPTQALADLLDCDTVVARRRVRVAEDVCPRISMDGQVLPARLPATGVVFALDLITALDQDGPGEREDEPAQVSDLHVSSISRRSASAARGLGVSRTSILRPGRPWARQSSTTWTAVN
jgi:hypothetical protein